MSLVLGKQLVAVVAPSAGLVALAGRLAVQSWPVRRAPERQLGSKFWYLARWFALWRGNQTRRRNTRRDAGGHRRQLKNNQMLLATG